MLAAIDAARSSVLLEMYLVHSGVILTQFIASLRAAARRGARVCVVFDAFGSLGLSRADRQRLEEGGVELRAFNPLELHKRLGNLLRDHRKLLIMDGCTAFVGGTGLTDEFAPTAARPAWRELMVRIEGPVVADWQRAFAHTWRRCGPELELPAAPPCLPHAGADGRLSLSEARQRSVLANGVLRRLDTSMQRAWIMSAYFVPARRFRAALGRAARRGVDVRLLAPGARTDHPWVRYASRRFYASMLRAGVRIFEYQPPVLHGKVDSAMTGCRSARATSIGGASGGTWRPTRRSPTHPSQTPWRRSSNGTLPCRVSSAAATGTSVPGSSGCVRTSRAQSIVTSTAGGAPGVSKRAP